VFVWKRFNLTFSITREYNSMKFSVRKPANREKQCVLKHFCISSTCICQNFGLMTKLGLLWRKDFHFAIWYWDICIMRWGIHFCAFWCNILDVFVKRCSNTGRKPYHNKHKFHEYRKFDPSFLVHIQDVISMKLIFQLKGIVTYRR